MYIMHYPRSTRGMSTLTLSSLLAREKALNMLIAFSASACSDIVTKAKPFDMRLTISWTRTTDVTVPACANKVLISSSVVDLFRFPT